MEASFERTNRKEVNTFWLSWKVRSGHNFHVMINQGQTLTSQMLKHNQQTWEQLMKQPVLKMMEANSKQTEIKLKTYEFTQA